MVRFWRWLRPWLPWTVVRVFGSLTYFNISYGVLLLVPVLHELYARAVPAMEWFGAPGEFPVTLKWLYAASLIYAGAILLYQIFCPAEVKRSQDRQDYIQSQFEIFQRADPQHRIKIVLARLHPVNDAKWREQIESLHRESANAERASERQTAKSQLDDLLAKMHGHAVQAYLVELYERQNVSRPLARWMSLTLYIAGCLILLTLLVIRSISVFADYREGRVLIKTEVQGGVLRLLAYTFQEQEFKRLETVLKINAIDQTSSPIEPDRYKREGRRYYVPSQLIARFGTFLKGSFDTSTGQFSPAPTPGGSPYACKEKVLGGKDGAGCLDMQANDDNAAMVACSLIAGEEGWYYGEAEQGMCAKKKSGLW
jgi:hypothetical protein